MESWLRSRLGELARGRVLDVGCGEGRYLPAGGIGIDVDEASLRAARGRSVLVAVADARALPFSNGTFDTALAIRMLNDTGDVDAALREMRRVLRAGGRAIVFTRARPAEGDRLDGRNGAQRLARFFASVRVERPPDRDDRAALFIATR